MITERINDLLWGYPLLVILLSGGLYLSFRNGFSQFRIVKILVLAKNIIFDNSGREKGISPLQGFSTALAATVGTGSVVGVGAALAAGGKGAVFWMWISAFIGMSISYAENFLGAKYSGQNGICGAMSYLEKIGRGKIIAVIYALFSVLASLGMGNMVQANSITSAAVNGLHLSGHLTAFAVVIFTAFTVSGKNRTAKLCERLVPVMAIFFCLGSLYIILCSPLRSLEALKSIVLEALSLKALCGGILGSAITEGLKRGAFSNEAGLGSTVAVHSSCKISSCEKQGIMGMAEVFIDTMVICSLTALVILNSGADITDPDCAVTAYSLSLGTFGGFFISSSLILFALATIAGWFFIGERSWLYLFPKNANIYKCLCVLCAYLGAVHSPALIWGISDIFNALMVIPNMMGVLLLSKEICRPTFSGRT